MWPPLTTASCVACEARLAPPDIPVVVVATKVDLVQAPAVSYAQAKVHSDFFALAPPPPHYRPF
jgi:hypothetical protein